LLLSNLQVEKQQMISWENDERDWTWSSTYSPFLWALGQFVEIKYESSDLTCSCVFSVKIQDESQVRTLHTNPESLAVIHSFLKICFLFWLRKH
jgi:hypothetical protein